MILYFSATGNCRYVAERIAQANDDEILSMTEAAEIGRYSFEADTVGIITPTYFWGLPSVVKEFLSKVEIKAGYIWFIATYGTTPGGSGYFTDKCIGGKTDAFFSVKMADTWTVWFDLSTPEAVGKFTKNTETEINDAITRIRNRERGNFMKNKVPVFSAKIAYSTYDSARATKNLSADENCIGCGLCAAKCPAGAIEMHDKRPVWVKDKCAMCFGCLHRCPKFSIQYGSGKGTRKHGQYLNPNVKI
ncbi:MAG: EFR1 family ferrodoxin [Ruminiclostridium sp.]|nr:EFR1 family ferrodoxin [Ruminiclostridium sp.]